jgi:hypothetical protein
MRLFGFLGNPRHSVRTVRRHLRSDQGRGTDVYETTDLNLQGPQL